MKKSRVVLVVRTCVGCGKRKPKEALFRSTLNAGCILIDKLTQEEGRGAYLCYDRSCLRSALKKNAFARAFKAPVQLSGSDTAGTNRKSQIDVVDERLWKEMEKIRELRLKG